VKSYIGLYLFLPFEVKKNNLNVKKSQRSLHRHYKSCCKESWEGTPEKESLEIEGADMT